TVNAGATAASINGSLGLGAVTRTLTVANGSFAQDLTISAAISGGTGAGITLAGTGATVAFSGANSYTGATTVSTGVLALGANEVIPDSSAVSLAAGTT